MGSHAPLRAHIGSLVLAVLLTALVAACGLSPEDKSGLGIGGDQVFRGYFVYAGSDQAASGLDVVLTNTGDSGTTDESGLVEIISSGELSGTAEIVISGPRGSSNLTIDGIPAGTRVIWFSAELNGEATEVKLSALQFDGDQEVDPTPTARAPSDGPSRDPTATPGTKRPTPKPTSPPKLRPTPRPTSRPGGGTPRLCMTCHEDRGGPRCGDARWEALHRAVYKCSTKSEGPMGAQDIWRLVEAIGAAQ